MSFHNAAANDLFNRYSQVKQYYDIAGTRSAGAYLNPKGNKPKLLALSRSLWASSFRIQVQARACESLTIRSERDGVVQA